MELCPPSTFLSIFTLLFALPRPAATAGLLEDGEDFSNNLVSDLAPYVITPKDHLVSKQLTF